jgi:hypothetical protein
MVSPKPWVFVQSAVSVIFSAILSPIVSLVNFFLFSVLIWPAYFSIIAIHLIQPNRLDQTLNRLFNWIKKYFRHMVIVLFSGFRIFFQVNGITGRFSYDIPG